MKIAVCGSGDELRLNFIKSFITNWPMYATPADTIFNKETKFNRKDFSEPLPKKLNDVEKILLNKLILLKNQYVQYKEEKHIIYDGSPIDLIVNALTFSELQFIRDEIVVEIINNSKKLMESLDVIYWLPNSDTKEDEDKFLEKTYEDLYKNYQNDFYNSPFFNHENCPSFLILESKNPINEVSMLIDKKGNLESDKNDDLLDIERIKKVLKNEKLIEAVLKNKKFTEGSLLL